MKEEVQSPTFNLLKSIFKFKFAIVEHSRKKIETKAQEVKCKNKTLNKKVILSCE